MNVEELFKDGGMIEFAKKIVNDNRFLALKDAFVAHAPGGDAKIETSVAVSHGMHLGTRYVFNELEKIARTPKPQAPNNKRGGTSGQDPDLES